MSEEGRIGHSTTIGSVSYGQPSITVATKGDLEPTGRGPAFAAEPSDPGELINILSSVAGNMLDISPTANESMPSDAGSAAVPTGAEPAPPSELPLLSTSTAAPNAEASVPEPVHDEALPHEPLPAAPAAPQSVVTGAGRGEPQEPKGALVAAPERVVGQPAGAEELLSKSGEEVARELNETLELPVEATANEPIPDAPLAPIPVPPVADPLAEPQQAGAPVPEEALPPAEGISPPLDGRDAEEAIDIEADEVPLPPEPGELAAPEQQQQGEEALGLTAGDSDRGAPELHLMEGLQLGAEQPLVDMEGVDASGGGGGGGGEGGAGEAAGGEAEDEDIDIEDVDEEEEAKIKEAMGVGLGPGEAAEPFAGGEYAANGGDGGVLEAEGDETQGLGSDDKLHAPRPRNKRKLAEDGSFIPGVVRRTRQRTARPAHKLKKRIVPGGGELPYLHLDAAEDEEEVAGEPPAAAAKLRRAKMASATAGSPTEVRFSIKSFAVPELVVALPETASVSALKKAVMEAAMTLLGGGLRVRVLLQGKRMSDEATSLAQAGISRAALGGKTSDALAFMLEPSSLVSSPGTVDNDPLLILSQAAGTPSPGVDLTGARPLFGVAARAAGRLKTKALRSPEGGPAAPPFQPPEPQVNIYGEPIVKGRMGGVRPGKPGSLAVPSPHTTRVAAAQALAAIRSQAQEQAKEEPLTAGSGAIVLHQSAYEQGQSLALVHHKRAGGMQLMNMEGRRRIRRPFTVAEVGALVDAVEQLGTGRCAAALTSAWWRDVKMRAFSQAKHRTYVDLKDKWRALVRTAQIPPHQRRGEPIPQELLDRVVRAHAYWTEQLQLEMMEDER